MEVMAGKITQQGKALAAKPDDSGLVSGTHMVEGERPTTWKLSSDFLMSVHTHTHTN